MSLIKNDSREIVHLRIDVSSDMVVKITPYLEPMYGPYLSEMIKYLALLGYIDTDDEFTDENMTVIKFKPYYLSETVTRYLRVEDGKVLLGPFWQDEYCRGEGFNKSHFVRIQLVLYELKEFNEESKFNFEIWYDNEKRVYPIWGETRPRHKKKLSKHMIKGIKKRSSMKNAKEIKRLKDCESRAVPFEPGFIHACCVCNTKDRILATIGE